MIKRREAYIDADILAYKAAAVTEEDWEGQPYVDLPSAVRAFNDMLSQWLDGVRVSRVVLCLSDGLNWRKELEPSYKAHRKDQKPPTNLAALRHSLKERKNVLMVPELEADDVIGIHCSRDPNGTIAISTDKDFLGVPLELWNPDKRVRTSVSVEEADRWHLIQTLAGDATDGYGGCPGVGVVTASRMLDKKLKVVPEQREVTRGKRKGSIETKWRGSPAANGWETVVSLYRRAGLSEADALLQARLARILRWNEYDGNGVKLWLPPTASRALCDPRDEAGACDVECAAGTGDERGDLSDDGVGVGERGRNHQ